MTARVRAAMKSRLAVGMFALVFMMMTGAASVAKADSPLPIVPMTGAEATMVAGEGWLQCLTLAAAAAVVIGTGGLAAAAVTTGELLLAGAGALVASVEIVCECSSYIDSAIGTNFSGACS